MEKYSPDKKFVVMTKEHVRAVDSWAINTIGIPGVVLMENAGRSCAELIKEKLKDVAHPKVCIFCGTGNNGGDGYVIARHLLNSGFEVVVVICGDRKKIKGIVDGIFGTGLDGQLSNEYKELIESINAQNCPILAVDIPSGLDCDTGQPLGAAIRASYTVTFVAVKKGFTSEKAIKYTGEIFVASIGVEPTDKTSN